jgi:hypothetical protein
MTDSALRSDASLPDLLADRARHASDRRLALDVAGGVLAAAAAVYWRPRPWILLLAAATCFAAFGAWGIADRAAARWVRPLRALAAVVGALAALALAAGVVALGLGTIIS